MISNRPDGYKPVFNALDTEEKESLWIADTILDNVAKNMKYSDHTILVRAASQTRSLEEAFIKRKVPYKILSGAKFYESEEIRTVLSYMRMVYSLTDMDLLYTISRPRRGFGKKSVEKLKNAAAQNNCSLFKALGKQIEDGDITQKNVIEYYNAISELHDTYVAYTCTDIVNKCFDMGYRQALEQDIDQTRLDNVSELIRTITALEEDNQEKVELADLLSHFALFSAQDEDGEYNVVKVMTIHTAKGLEFDTVFVPGLVEGQFPSSRLRNEDEYEEERRLLYVAMTRAKNMLYLSTYRKKDGRFGARPSAFLRPRADRNAARQGNVRRTGQVRRAPLHELRHGAPPHSGRRRRVGLRQDRRPPGFRLRLRLYGAGRLAQRHERAEDRQDSDDGPQERRAGHRAERLGRRRPW